MNNLLEWFSSGLKLKRWFFLMLVGVILMSVSMAKFTSSDELEILQLVVYGILFVAGFASVIMSYVMSQRRILQAIAEANANPNGRDVNIKRLLFDKKMLDKNSKIVVIGDGDGLAALLKGLKIFSNNITAIVNVVGSKKDSSFTLQIEDVKKAMIALANKEEVLDDFFNTRVMDGNLAGRKQGDVFFELLGRTCDGNLSRTIEYMSKILAMRGSILPATLDNVTIGAVMDDGTRCIGRNEVNECVENKGVKIERVFLTPERCAPAEEVIRSIKEADVIIIGPGSLYTGIIPTLLIKEVSDAIRKSKACRIFVSNIMTEKNQTDSFSLSDYINVIHEHAGKGLFDYCIFSDSDIMPEYIRRANKDGCDLVELDKNNVKDIQLIVDDLTIVDEKGNIRHNPIKLAQSIFKIVCDNMDLENSDKAIEYYTTRSKLKKITNKNKKKNILFRDVKIVSGTKRKRK